MTRNGEDRELMPFARHARDELELKVLERTAELQKAAEERLAHLHFLEGLDRVNRALQGSNDLEQMVSEVLDVMLSIFDCDRAGIGYADPEAPIARVLVLRSRPEFALGRVATEGIPMSEGFARFLGQVWTSPRPLRFDAQSDPPLPEAQAKLTGARSALIVALHPKGEQPHALSIVQCSYARVWTAAEERLFQEIGRRLTDGLTTLLMFRNLRLSEARLAEAQRIAHVAYWERSLDTDRVTWSDEAYRIFGLTPHDRPISLSGIREMLHPDDRPHLRESHDAAIAGGPRYNEEYRIVRPDGDVRIVHTQGEVVRDETGRARRMFGTIQDITERRQAEELTRRIFETLPDTVYVVDRDYRLRRVNAVFERDWHIPAESVAGMHVADLVGRKAFDEQFKPVLDRCFAGEVVSYATWLDLASGRRYRSGTLAPLRSAGMDQIDAALVIVRDLTDYMRASEALREAQAELARVTRVTILGEITASIAHEVNQPLAAVVMSGNACRRWLAADPPLIDEAREAAAQVIANAERAGKIIHGIRALIYKGEPERRVLEVNDLIREALDVARSDLDRRHVVIRTELAEGLPAIRGDRVQLQQVLINLLVNAGDAMEDVPAGQRTLTVRSRGQDTGDVRMEVNDRGKGIEPAHAAQVFKAFFTTKATGLGMGLAISRSIVEAHGGRIWATSHEGGGTAMCVALPVAPEQAG